MFKDSFLILSITKEYGAQKYNFLQYLLFLYHVPYSDHMIRKLLDNCVRKFTEM